METEPEVPPLKLAHIAVCPQCRRVNVGMNDCPACGASPTSSIPYVPASALAEVWEAIDSLFTLMSRDAEGEWCFNSLSKDAAKFQRAMNALEAAREAALNGE